jgi:3(or 17)beta-hydroxysteroid dehydrogenase
MTGRVAGKLAFVTGAASGLGRACAGLLVREGARVALADRNVAGVEELAAQLGPAAFAVPLDVTKPEDWTAALATVEQRLGGMNILVHSAGVGMVADVEQTTLEQWRRIHAVNLDGVFLGTQGALPIMRRSGPGSIVMISSVAGIIAGHNLAAYNSSKAAVRMLAKTVAMHCARDGGLIRCNSVHPSFIDTPMVQAMFAGAADPAAARAKLARQIPLNRLGEPEDVAYAVLYLASDESRFVTGSELLVDGGICAQ